MIHSNWKASSSTPTEVAQIEVEHLLEDLLVAPKHPVFHRNKHARFVSSNLVDLPSRMQGLMASQPWLVYWTLHAADLLGIVPQLLQTTPSSAITSFLLSCFQYVDETDDSGCRIGGFAGGPSQLPHLATTYAAVCAMCILGEDSLKQIDREALARWFLSLRTREGGYTMHDGGECDVRASYCVAVVTSLLQLPFSEILLSEESAKFVAACQTFEGGIACSPSSTEAHGGYTQCGVAALLLMKKYDAINHNSLGRWLANRQFEFEGGFSGRTNKLVDSCYGHWVGSSHVLLRVGEALRKFDVVSSSLSAADVFALDLAQIVDVSSLQIPRGSEGVSDSTMSDERLALMAATRFHEESIIDKILFSSSSKHSVEEEGIDFTDEHFLDEDVGDYLFNQRKLQDYILRCCQNKDVGGLMDKPGHPNDFYHTCYAMSGLCSAQNLQYLVHLRGSQCSSSTSGSTVPGHVAFAEAAKERKWIPTLSEGGGVVLATDGSTDKLAALRAANPMINITKERVIATLKLFGGRTFF